MKNAGTSDHIWSISLSILLAVCMYFVLGSVESMDVRLSLYEKTTDISITFSLTLLGFLITAYTVIQVLDNRSWFNVVKDSDAFSNFCFTLKALILLAVVLFLMGLFLLVSPYIFGPHVIQVLYSLQVLLMVFIAIEIYMVSKTLIQLLQK